MVEEKDNCAEKRMEAGEDIEPIVCPEDIPEVTIVKGKELEVIVENPGSPNPAVKTKVRIKVLVAVPLLLLCSCSQCRGGLGVRVKSY